MDIQGIAVFNAEDADLAPLIRTRVHDAFNLIATTDRRWLRVIRSSAPRVLVRPASSSGFFQATGTILLTPNLIREQSASVIASILVHESVHARLRANRIRSWPDIRERVERACLKQQIAFARRLPDSDALVAHLVRFEKERWW